MNHVTQAFRLRVRRASRPAMKLAARRRRNPQPGRLRHYNLWVSNYEEIFALTPGLTAGGKLPLWRRFQGIN